MAVKKTPVKQTPKVRQVAVPKGAAPRGASTTARGNGDFVELGHAGYRQFSGYIFYEFLPQLRGLNGRKQLREMVSNDPYISAGLNTIKQFIRHTDVRPEPVNTSPEALQAYELVTTAFVDMATPWQDVIMDICRMLGFGWSALEWVPKKCQGDNPGTWVDKMGVKRPLPPSTFDDGLIRWAKWAPRSEESLERWDIEPGTGTVKGLVQRPMATGDKLVTIPSERLLLFNTEHTLGSPEGTPLVRGAYIPWYHSKMILFYEGVGAARDLTGYPVLYLPAEVLNATAADPQLYAARSAYLQLLKNVQRDEQEGVALPSDRDEHGQLRYEFKLMNSGGRRQFDTDTILGRLAQEKLLAIMADFIRLGHERVGSYSLGQTKLQVFTMAVAGWIDGILQTISRMAIPQLLRLNGLPAVAAPVMAHGAVNVPDLQELSQYLATLTGIGFDLTQIPGMENRLLAIAELPTAEQTVNKRARTLKTLKRKFAKLPRTDREGRDEALAEILQYAREARNEIRQMGNTNGRTHA